MSVASYDTVEVVNFKGPTLRLEPTDVPPEGSLYSTNCEYNPGRVQTRCGFTSVWNPSEAITTLYSWIKVPDAISIAGNYLAYFTPTPATPAVKLISDVTNPTSGSQPYTLFSAANATGAAFASDGSRMFSCVFDSNGSGVAQGRVTSIDVAALYTDKLFLGPITTKPTVTNSGTAGFVTAGEHRIGYVIVTRNGFTGKVSPVDGTTQSFDTTSSITAVGGEKLSFSITGPPWPTEAAYLYIVMTPTTNLNSYFIVPNMGPYGITGTSTVTATIDISDDDLIATGQDVTANANLLTQDAAGAGPFNPFLIVPYGQRTCYFTDLGGISRYYASDTAKSQQITADLNVRYLPGQRKITSAFVLGGVLYVLGPHWTYSDFDNPLVNPVEWAAPQKVDGAIGALGPMAVNVNASQERAWVADEGGLYLFQGGAYADRPISYYDQPTWDRINLAAGTTVQVKDNKDKREVLVLAPLTCTATVNTSGTSVTWVSGEPFLASWVSGTAVSINGSSYTISSATATTLTLTGSAGTQTAVRAVVKPTYTTHLLKYDYSEGLTPERVKPSLYDLANVPYNPGSMEIVQNGTTRRQELWIGRAQAGKVMRQMNQTDDQYPFNDDSAAINSQFETAYLPGMNRQIGTIWRHYAAWLRVKGVGTLAITSYGMDRNQTFVWTPITLSTNPGAEPFRRIAMNSEGCSHRFVTNVANNYFELSAVRHAFLQGPLFR